MFHDTVSIVVLRAGDETGAGEVRTRGLITGLLKYCWLVSQSSSLHFQATIRSILDDPWFDSVSDYTRKIWSLHFGEWTGLKKYLKFLPWSGGGEHDHWWSPHSCWRMTRMRPGEQWTCGQCPGAGWDSWSWSGRAPPHCCCSLPPSADPQTCSPEHKISAEIFYSLIHYLLPITRLRGRYAPLS